MDSSAPTVDIALYCFYSASGTSMVVEFCKDGKTRATATLTIPNDDAASLEYMARQQSAWNDEYDGFKVISIATSPVYWNTGGSNDGTGDAATSVSLAPTASTAEQLFPGFQAGRFISSYREEAS